MFLDVKIKEYMKNLIFVSLLLTTLSFSFAQSINKSLKVGSKGNDVKILQQVLVNEGYLPDESYVTGTYGKLTAKAVSELQKDNGVKSVGYVGPQTIKLINGLTGNTNSELPKNTNVGVKTVTNTNVVVSKKILESKKVVVNKTNNIQNNNLTKETFSKAKKEIRPIIKTNKYKEILNNNKDLSTGFVKPAVNVSKQDKARVIIRYKSAPTKESEDKVISSSGKIRKINSIPLIATEMLGSDIDKILTDTNILSIEKDEEVKIDSSSEYLNSWGVSKIGSESVFAKGFTGKNVKIAVLDTGIDYNHQDLVNNYVGGYNFVSNSTNTYDDNGHGTHVSGIAVALNNDSGVVGVAPEAKIYSLKILNSTGSGYSSDIIEAIDWAINNGIQVINLSFGTKNYPGTALEDAFARAEESGIVVVASAGNNGTCSGTTTDIVNYPAKFDSVLSVGSVDSTNNHSCFSATGESLDISAPGASINSTKLGGTTGLYSGTSMASPHVAGAAAVLIGAGVPDRNSNGRINDDVRDILKVTAFDLGTVGLDGVYGYGLLKIDNAINYLQILKATTSPATTTDTQGQTQEFSTTTTETPPATTEQIVEPVATTTPSTETVATTTPTPNTGTIATSTNPISEPVAPVVSSPATSTPAPATATTTVDKPYPVPIISTPTNNTVANPTVPITENPPQIIVPVTPINNPVIIKPTTTIPVYKTLPDQASDRAKLQQELNRYKKEAEERIKKEIEEKLKKELEKREKENKERLIKEAEKLKEKQKEEEKRIREVLKKEKEKIEEDRKRYLEKLNSSNGLIKNQVNGILKKENNSERR